MSDDYEQLLKLLRETRRRSSASSPSLAPRLPSKVQRDLADKRLAAREMGVCLYCDAMLMRRPDGRLGAQDIVEQGGSYSLRCSGPDGHAVDSGRLGFGGHVEQLIGEVRECLDPPF